jgi:Na+-transporting NADH:ubiquinone oxidoreductase subunit C
VREKVYTVGFMIAVATVFTAGVSGISLLTGERVRLNRELAEKRVVMRVLQIDVPEDAELREVMALYEGRVSETGVSIEEKGQSFPILAGRDAEARLLGYAFEISGQGFWDVIRGYLAVDGDLRTIRGVAFFEQKETPGLGAEITKDWFSDQFAGKELPPETPPDGLLVRLRPPGSELGPHDVDAVTGATETSRRVERLLNERLVRFLEVMSPAPMGTVLGGD